jgi:hypothetical protein
MNVCMGIQLYCMDIPYYCMVIQHDSTHMYNIMHGIHNIMYTIQTGLYGPYIQSIKCFTFYTTPVHSLCFVRPGEGLSTTKRSAEVFRTVTTVLTYTEASDRTGRGVRRPRNGRFEKSVMVVDRIHDVHGSPRHVSVQCVEALDDEEVGDSEGSCNLELVQAVVVQYMHYHSAPMGIFISNEVNTTSSLPRNTERSPGVLILYMPLHMHASTIYSARHAKQFYDSIHI